MRLSQSCSSLYKITKPGRGRCIHSHALGEDGHALWGDDCLALLLLLVLTSKSAFQRPQGALGL